MHEWISHSFIRLLLLVACLVIFNSFGHSFNSMNSSVLAMERTGLQMKRRPPLSQTEIDIEVETETYRDRFRDRTNDAGKVRLNELRLLMR